MDNPRALAELRRVCEAISTRGFRALAKPAQRNKSVNRRKPGKPQQAIAVGYRCSCGDCKVKRTVLVFNEEKVGVASA